MRVPPLLVLAALFVAGCTSAPPGKLGPSSTNVTSPTSVLPPDNRSGSVVAFQETNKTEAGAGGVAHTHDYWAGRERVTLLEKTLEFGPGSDAPVVDITMPSGTMVFEGTGQVEITLSDPQREACTILFTSGGRVCTGTAGVKAPDPVGSTGMKVRLRHASTSTWIDVGDAAWGKPAVYKISDPKQTDMPHSSSSLWQFQIEGKDASDRTLTFKVKVDAVRAPGPIPTWPAHPLFYADSHNRVVFDGPVKFQANGTFLIGASDPAPTPLVPQKLVSYGTKTLTLYLNVTKLAAPDPANAPTNWNLQLHNATGHWVQAFDDNGTHPASQKSLVWTLSVDDGGMDSPYSDGSRWAILPDGAVSNPAISCFGGCSTYTLEAHATLIASDLVAAAYDRQSDPFG